MAIDQLRAHQRDAISGDAPRGDTSPANALGLGAQTTGSRNSHASIVAHAALFDGVATTPGLRTSELPLNATRHTPARRASFAWFDTWLGDQNLDGADTLDLGCGRGEVSVQLALLGATVTGIDVSRESLSRAQTLAQKHGVAGRISLDSGNAEALPFDDGSFDLAVCAGLMSFVDFDRTAAELSRVTRRDGTVVIMDTLGHNPIARMGRKRRLVHGETTHFQVENIMTCDHIDRLRAHFGLVDVHTFDLLTVPMIIIENCLGRIHPRLRDILAPISAGLRALDRGVLKWRPLRRYAFRTVIVLKWPRVHESD
ncbi:MAG: 2-polyprenyl-3-methyl-5-hydroxy-6-metoxy-1,4-benzoquinol methylase [Paracoccaceae bacterium]|jgi:2-polyprenyl-3-methyl-5-hydroxy-6-metoxy-1,4-benzoquinol methylase